MKSWYVETVNEKPLNQDNSAKKKFEKDAYFSPWDVY